MQQNVLFWEVHLILFTLVISLIKKKIHVIVDRISFESVTSYCRSDAWCFRGESHLPGSRREFQLELYHLMIRVCWKTTPDLNFRSVLLVMDISGRYLVTLTVGTFRTAARKYVISITINCQMTGNYKLV